MRSRRMTWLLGVIIAASLRPAVATASPLGCQRAIERGSARYLEQLLVSVQRCTAPGPYGTVFDCFEALAGDADLAHQRELWSRRTARKCATTSLASDLGYYDTCGSDRRPGSCSFPSAVLDAPGDDNDLLDCLACQVRGGVRQMVSSLFAGHSLAATGVAAEIGCEQALALRGLDAFRTVNDQLVRCLKRRRGTSIAACMDDPTVAATVNASIASWRSQAVADCAGVDPFTINQTLNYSHTCDGNTGFPGQPCRTLAPACTFVSTNLLDGPGGEDDLLDC